MEMCHDFMLCYENIEPETNSGAALPISVVSDIRRETKTRVRPKRAECGNCGRCCPICAACFIQETAMCLFKVSNDFSKQEMFHWSCMTAEQEVRSVETLIRALVLLLLFRATDLSAVRSVRHGSVRPSVLAPAGPNCPRTRARSWLIHPAVCPGLAASGGCG